MARALYNLDLWSIDRKWDVSSLHCNSLRLSWLSWCCWGGSTLPVFCALGTSVRLAAFPESFFPLSHHHYSVHV